MSLMASPWRRGHPQAALQNIPEDEKCPKCKGRGTGMSKHQFGVGSSYIPCSACGGSGRIQADPDPYPKGSRIPEVDPLQAAIDVVNEEKKQSD
jgi:DnaJ-class molecular chaperone